MMKLTANINNCKCNRTNGDLSYGPSRAICAGHFLTRVRPWWRSQPILPTKPYILDMKNPKFASIRPTRGLAADWLQLSLADLVPGNGHRQDPGHTKS